MRRKLLQAASVSLIAMTVIAATPAWEPAPWLSDLQQLRSTIEHSYPNLEWLTGQREVSLDRWFARAGQEIRDSGNDAEARHAFDRLIDRFNDGHLVLTWPRGRPSTVPLQPGDASSAKPPRPIAALCAARGYDASQVTAGAAASLPGYVAIEADGPFPAGSIDANGKKLGVIRLGSFSPQGYPALCEQAVANARIAGDKPCDEACDDLLRTETFALMTRGLISTIEQLRAAGASVLLVDLTRNGGGTEWAEAAARTLSPLSLRSAPIRVIRGEAWAARWRELATKLRGGSAKGPPGDRDLLLDMARRADEIANGLRPCAAVPCSRLAQSGFASGLLAESPVGGFRGKAWGADVFSPAQFPYRDGVWEGPLIVLVDSETWSAAEQFAALLQDNGAAVIMGGRTGGAGCGHLYSNEPTLLTHSGATLEMPNCARFRKDGSNDVGGIIPDISTGVRSNDGPAYAGRITASHLPDAIALAERLSARPHPTRSR